PVPRQVAAMTVCEAANAERLSEPEHRAGVRVERVAYDDRAVVLHRDEAPIEGGIEVRCEQDAVVNVEPLGVGFAVGPGFDMARAQQRRDGETGDGAPPLPEVEKPVAEQVLPDALDDEALGLGRLRQPSDLLLERVKQLVRQRFRELERTPEKTVQRGHIGYGAPASGALRPRGDHRGPVIAGRARDVLLRERGEEDGVAEGTEPHAQRALGARDDEPVALGLKHLVEAVVGGGFLEARDEDGRERGRHRLRSCDRVEFGRLRLPNWPTGRWPNASAPRV